MGDSVCYAARKWPAELCHAAGSWLAQSREVGLCRRVEGSSVQLSCAAGERDGLFSRAAGPRVVKFCRAARHRNESICEVMPQGSERNSQ